MSQPSSSQILSPSALAMVAQHCKVARDQVRVVPIDGASTGCRRAVALAGTQAGVVKTELLHVDTESQYAKTDTPVTFQYGESSGSAEGLTYDHKKVC